VVPPQGQLACFRHLDTTPADAPPEVSRAQAEARVREPGASQKRMHLGAVIAAYHVTVIASALRHPQTGADELRGRDAWVLGFEHEDGQHYYAMIDARTGQFLSGCTGPADASGIPAPSTTPPR
jgi:hypothetical protein